MRYSALRAWAALPDDKQRIRVLETGLSDATTARQLATRSISVLRACVGFSTARRAKVLQVLAENYRQARDSWKLDLALPDGGQVELFSFKGAPARPSYPEAQGLRHLAFAVTDVGAWTAHLESQGIAVETIRTDEYTGQRFVFFADPDGLPLELYEVAAQSTSPST